MFSCLPSASPLCILSPYPYFYSSLNKRNLYTGNVDREWLLSPTFDIPVGVAHSLVVEVAVTGSAGFIGSHLAEALAMQGHHVVGIDSLTDYYDPNIKKLNVQATIDKGVEFHDVDLLDEKLVDVLEGVEFVYHLAAQPGISATVPFSDYVRNNLSATHNLLEACRNLAGFKCLINISTSSVYGKDATEPG